MVDPSATNSSRRGFLRAAPTAIAALGVADITQFASFAAAQSDQPTGSPGKYQLFTADTIQTDVKALQASPGNQSLINVKNYTVSLTVETAKSATEFEWHEGRDHVLHILDGSTVVEVGGTPKNGHSIAPNEWHAPISEGSTALTLHKGDVLVIPRNTPHKRTTTGTVTFLQVSPQNAATS